ncbi:U-box domain-containing protein 12-like [Coffea eugenioides]|uniref:U-box domain-containing protein 12-like n=1 Tax=Coffea eugenioides TaxID=49369 RepID=UPI000F6144F2|nr:U-box domain-containing protein 12-like [Coffea eugenioides]
MEALLSNEREAQILAARELGKLATKLRQKLPEKGIISRLVMMLRTQDYEATEAALCSTLSSFSQNKIRIANSGAIPVLLEIIQCQKESLIDLAAAALLVLPSCSANKLAIAASGAIPILFGKQSEMIEKARALLEKMVSLSEIALKEVAETASLVIHFLVEAIEEGTPLCKEHAAAMLLVMCQSCRDRCKSRDWQKILGLQKDRGKKKKNVGFHPLQQFLFR